jgi:hypothetical protein
VPVTAAAEPLLAVIPDPTCFGACSGCGRHGVPYEHRGLLFGGLCAYRGDRLCPACRDARMSETGVDVLVVSYQPQVTPHVINTVQDRDVTFTGFVFPEQRGGYSHTPAARIRRDPRAA